MGPETALPWGDWAKSMGPFFLVVIVVVWVLQRLVPKMLESIDRQSTAGRESLEKLGVSMQAMLAKQEESGASIIQGILTDLRASRLEFMQALGQQQKIDTDNAMRLYEAIERGNRLLLILIARTPEGALTPEVKDALGLQEKKAGS